MRYFWLLFSLFTLFSASGSEWKARVLPRTMFFTQAQLKYTLNPQLSGVQYYSHWTDWPLFIDSSLKESDKQYRGLQYPDYVRHQQGMKAYGLDGLVYWQDFIRRGTRSDITAFTARSQIPGFHLIPQLSSGLDMDKDIPHILNSPQVLRFGDKVVVQCYSIRTDEKLIEAKAALHKKYGDKFFFIMRKDVNHSLRKRFHNNNNKLLPEDQKILENEIRSSLDIADAFGWWNMVTLGELSQGRRLFDTAFYRVLMELTAKVMNEKPYRNKLLVAEAVVGHENASRNGQIMSSNGTQGLRDTILIALANGADIIAIPEWDEQNENTSLRPTVYNGTSHMRILRHITGKVKGKAMPRLPFDNPERPDLILSMRKIISLGELLEFELLNIPDAEKVMPFSAQLNIRDINGKLLHAFPEYKFTGKEMQEFRPALPSEKFGMQRVLLPEIIITMNGKKQIFAEGLAAVQIQPTWNSDYKWVKQPLRDLPDEMHAEFSLSLTPENKILRASAKVNSSDLLSFAEVLDNGDCIFSAGTPNEKSWRENQDFLVFRVGTQSLTVQNITGTVTVENARSQWRSLDSKLDYRNYHISQWHRGDWVRIPRNELDKAVFKIDFPGSISATIPVREVFDRRSIILGGKKGFNLALTRQLRQYFHPENLNCKKLEFTADFTPDLHNSVIQLQLVAQNGKIWRSKPILTGKTSEKTAVVTVYSESAGKPVKVTIPASELPDLSYELTENRGLIQPVDYGRRFWGIRGGFTDLACLRHCGGDSSSNGVPCSWYEGHRLWQKEDILFPQIVICDDKSTAWNFDSFGKHVSFPQGTIPRRSGFTISFEIKPENVQRKQFVLSNRQTLPGALDHVWIEKGSLHLTYVNNQIRSFSHNTMLPLNVGKWNRIKISYDLENFVVSVNGTDSKKFAAPGPGLYDTSTMIGTWRRRSFKGQIRNLHIIHAPCQQK